MLWYVISMGCFEMWEINTQPCARKLYENMQNLGKCANNCENWKIIKINVIIGNNLKWI